MEVIAFEYLECHHIFHYEEISSIIQWFQISIHILKT